MNPTGQPFGSPYAAPPPPAGNAQQELNVPSILLIIIGALGVLSSLYGFVSSGASAEQMKTLMSDPNIPPAVKQGLEIFTGAASVVLNVLSLVVNGLIIYGAIQMRALKTYPLAITAAILAILPFSGCCCIGLPIGIWTMVILLRADVKGQFS